MSELLSFKHKKAVVNAIQLSAATQEDIVNLLMPLVISNQLTDFSATYNAKSDCYVFTFRYWTDSSIKTLTSGDYLVIPTDSPMEAWTAASFAATYGENDGETPVEPQPGVYADSCILDE